jgi:hypothetical protein
LRGDGFAIALVHLASVGFDKDAGHLQRSEKLRHVAAVEKGESACHKQAAPIY